MDEGAAPWLTRLLRDDAPGLGEFDYPAVARILPLVLTVAALVASFTLADPISPPLYVGLLLLATAVGVPIIAGIRPPFALPMWAFALLGGAPLALIHLGGERLGIVHLDAGSQYSLGLLVVGQILIGAFAERWVILLAAPAAVLIPPARALVTGDFDVWGYWSAGIAFALAGPLIARRQQRILGQLHEAQHQLASDALASERRRIATEMHDLVGHTLGVLMLHLTAARMAALRGDATAAAATLAEAEQAGRQSVEDIHRVLVLLRPDGDAGLAAALPGMDDLQELVDGFRTAGMDVTLGIDGDVGQVSGAAALATHRIVAEGLTNAAAHAPGASVRVAVTVGGREIVVRVDNDAARTAVPPRRAGGLGLLGMRERVRALDGRLDAGPVGSGWTLSARMPAGAQGGTS